jgi:hypothetical protein
MSNFPAATIQPISFESEFFPAAGLGRAWFTFLPRGTLPPRPPKPPQPPILALLDAPRVRRERGQRQRPRRAARRLSPDN